MSTTWVYSTQWYDEHGLPVPTLREMTGTFRDSARYIRNAEAEAAVRLAAGIRVQTMATWNAVQRHRDQQDNIARLMTRSDVGRLLIGDLTAEAALVGRIGRLRRGVVRPDLNDRLRATRNRIYNLLRQHGDLAPQPVKESA